MVDFSEPFDRLLTQGMVLKDGEVMSKSKGNIVDPDEMIKKYGTDTIRLYILFAGPPETEMEWNDKGIEGSFRFLNRVWRLVEKVRDQKTENGRQRTEKEAELKRKTHETIKRVTEDVEGFQFNTAISAIMELVNTVYSHQSQVTSKEIKEAVENVVLLLSPFAPHICEEMWEGLGHEPGIFNMKWPGYDPAVLVQKKITLIVQINGKVRSRLDLPVDMSEAALKEKVMADPAVVKWIENRPVRNFIVIPNKLVNIVI
jgi:leucyl-tRNA synthetase